MSILFRESMEDIDANRIHGDLWQGSFPPRGPLLAHLGYTLLVLCSSEYQPPARKFPGVRVIHAPFEDDLRGAPSRATLQLAMDTADEVVAHLKGGLGPALVTCYAGLNRSGLVNGIVLRKLHGLTGDEAVQQIQFMREGALFNTHFVQALSVINRPI